MRIIDWSSDVCSSDLGCGRAKCGNAVIIIVILLALLVLLFTGIPIFAGLTLFGGGLLLIVQGDLGSIVNIIFGELNHYLLVAIPLFAFMAHIMIRGKVVDDLYDSAFTFTRQLPGGLARSEEHTSELQSLMR